MPLRGNLDLVKDGAKKHYEDQEKEVDKAINTIMGNLYLTVNEIADSHPPRVAVEQINALQEFLDNPSGSSQLAELATQMGGTEDQLLTMVRGLLEPLFGLSPEDRNARALNMQRVASGELKSVKAPAALPGGSGGPGASDAVGDNPFCLQVELDKRELELEREQNSSPYDGFEPLFDSVIDGLQKLEQDSDTSTQEGREQLDKETQRRSRAVMASAHGQLTEDAAQAQQKLVKDLKDHIRKDVKARGSGSHFFGDDLGDVVVIKDLEVEEHKALLKP